MKKFFASNEAPVEEKKEKGKPSSEDKNLENIKKSILLCSETINKLHSEQEALKKELLKHADVANKAHVNSNELDKGLKSLPKEVKDIGSSLNDANKEIEKLKGLLDLFEKRVKDIQEEIKEKNKNIDSIIKENEKINKKVDDNKDSINGAINSAVTILSDRLVPVNIAIENSLNKQKELSLKVDQSSLLVSEVSPLKSKIPLIEELQSKIIELEKKELGLNELAVKKVIVDNISKGPKKISGKIPNIAWESEIPPENVVTEFHHQVVGGIAHLFFRIIGDTSGVNVKSLKFPLPQGVIAPCGFDVKENNASFHVCGSLYADPVNGSLIDCCSMLKKIKNEWFIVFACAPSKLVGAIGSVSYMVD